MSWPSPAPLGHLGRYTTSRTWARTYNSAATSVSKEIFESRGHSFITPIDFISVSPELAIDWRMEESSNVRLPAHEVPGQPQDREVDDMRSFLGAIYQSIIVTAMEMARLIYGGPYQGSYRYSRESTVNLVRGARWDVLPYAKTEDEPSETQTSQGPERPKEPKMVAICIPPWNLSELDLQDFATQRTVSTRRTTRIHPTNDHDCSSMMENWTLLQAK